MDRDELLGCVGLFTLGIGVTVVSVILGAWALQTLWGWFLVPLFEVQSLRLVEAMGVSCIVNFLIARSTADTTKQDTDWNKAIAFAIFHPTFAVVFGWVIWQFM